MAKRPKRQRRRDWVPMVEGEMNPAYIALVYPDGLPEGTLRIRAYANDVYTASVIDRDDGWSYLTFKRHDRAAVRDWRHVQAIKNECCSPEREAVELFPAESRLVDTANQYHLYVAPAGETLPYGDHVPRQILTPAELAAAGNGGKARQRAWQPGLPTGAGAP